MATRQTQFTLSQVFNPSELKRIFQIHLNCKRENKSFHGAMMEFITDDMLKAMAEKGFEFDKGYLAYAVEYVIGQSGVRR